jgi:hypothetical protein
VNKKKKKMVKQQNSKNNIGNFKNAIKKSSKNLFRPFGNSIDNFYITDIICENSAIMAKASKVRLKNNFFKEKSIYN